MSRRWLLCSMAMLLLPACTLTSRVPLVTEPTLVPGLSDGLYQGYIAMEPKEYRKLPRNLRLQCLSPGYSFHERDDDNKLTGPLVTPFYCPNLDDKRKIARPTRLVQERVGYRVDNKDRLQFQRLSEGVFLMQVPGSADGKPKFDFALARPVAGGLDFVGLACTDFPSLHPYTWTRAPTPAADDLDAPANDLDAPAKSLKKSRHKRAVMVEPPDTTTRPAEAPADLAGEAASPDSNDSSCVASSLAAIRPELDVVLARLLAGEEPVVFLLRRIASTGAATGSPPR